MGDAVPLQMRRAALQIRATLLGWRAAMRYIRSRATPDSRESVDRVTKLALGQLEAVEGNLAADDDLTVQLRAARTEIHGATGHDLADSGEEAG